MNELVGQYYVFEDGDKIEVIQMKTRVPTDPDETLVTFHITQGNSIPRKLVMKLPEFLDAYGHLFKQNM